MTDRLIRLWGWIGGHRLLAGWAVAMLGMAAFSGGIALGAARQPAAHRAAGGEATAKLETTAVEAIVMGKRPNGFVARTRSGDLLVVRTNDATTYHLKNKPADVNAVRRGAIVLVLGRPAPREGVMYANAVSVRGQARSPIRPPEAIDLP
jgi:hypothetical protein